MNYVLAVIILGFWLAVMLRAKYISPSLVAASILSANILSFYIIQFSQLFDLIRIEHSYKYKKLYIGNEYPFLITFGFVVLLLCASHLRREFRGGVLEKKLRISRNGGAGVATAFSTACFGLSMLHALSTNLVFLGEYNVYLQWRDPSSVNITNDLVAFFHGNMGAVGVVLGVIIASSTRRTWGTTTLALFPYSYILLFEAASISRWLVVQLAIPAIILSFRTRYRIFLIPILVVLLVPVFAALKDVREERVLGIDVLLSSITTGVSVNGDFIVDAIGNILGGGLVVSEAAERTGITYPGQYVALSFSPLPSAIDGFDRWRSYEQRINIYGPFNVYSELYWMGWPWYLFYLSIVFYSARQCDIVEVGRRSGLVPPLMALAPAVLLYYGVLLGTQYPLRNSLRWIVISYLIALCVKAFAIRPNWRRHNTGEGAVDTAVGA
jgi:hypothetical protein